MREMQNLWYFTQVAQAGSFSAAAERLSLSAAALSKSIAGLEKRLNARLFIRTARALHLTEEGRALLDKVGASFGAIEDSYRTVSAASADPAGVVRLSSVTAYGKHCVLPLLPTFFEHHPQIDLVMSLHDGSRGLTRQAFDVRINWGEHKEKGKVSRTLCVMPLIAVASPAYLARHGTPRVPQDLGSHDCVNVRLSDGSRARWTFRARHASRRDQVVVTVTPHGRLLVMDELDCVVEAAEAGLGITISSAENVLTALREKRLLRVLEDHDVVGHGEMHSQIIIQYAPRRHLAPRVRALVDFLVGELKDRDPLEIVGGAARAAASGRSS